MGDDGCSLLVTMVADGRDKLGDVPSSRDLRVFPRGTPALSLRDKLVTKSGHDFFGLHNVIE